MARLVVPVLDLWKWYSKQKNDYDGVYQGFLCLAYHSFTQWKLKLTQTNKLVLRRILSNWVEWGIGVRRASVERGTNKQTADFHLSYSTVARDEVKHIFYYQISALKNKTCQHHEGVMLSCKKFLDFASEGTFLALSHPFCLRISKPIDPLQRSQKSWSGVTICKTCDLFQWLTKHGTSQKILRWHILLIKVILHKVS